MTRELALRPLATAIQVGNEANVVGAPAAADGAYGGVRRALALGVTAAATERRRAGRRDLLVGFNWASAGNAGPDAEFWRDLRREGGARLARDVDWVGLDVYPGTWSAERTDDIGMVRRAMARQLDDLRKRALPLAGLGSRVALRVTENGFPTGTARSEQQQATLMRAAVTTVNRLRGRYGVTDYRWFDLRDARSGSPDFQDGYGILRDDDSEKPAFATFAGLVRRLGR